MIFDTIVSEVAALGKQYLVGKQDEAGFQHALEMRKAEWQDNTHKEALAQIKVNEVAAASDNGFASGARPYCLYAFATALVLPIFVAWLVWAGTYICAWFGVEVPNPPPFPEIDLGLVAALTSAILGYTGVRTFEKVKGIATGAVK